MREEERDFSFSLCIFISFQYLSFLLGLLKGSQSRVIFTTCTSRSNREITLVLIRHTSVATGIGTNTLATTHGGSGDLKTNKAAESLACSVVSTLSFTDDCIEGLREKERERERESALVPGRGRDE